MENEESIDIEKIIKKSIIKEIDKYEMLRYENLLKERKVILDIIQACKGKDEEKRKKYEEILVKLEEEKEILAKSLSLRQNNKDEDDDLER